METISISREEQKKACDNITKQLRTFRAKVVCNVMGIPAARVPIVKFVHIKTGLSCDLRFFKALWKILRDRLGVVHKLRLQEERGRQSK